MDNHRDIPLDKQFAAAIEWWHDAGVEHEFVDEAQSLFIDEETTQAASATPPAGQHDAVPAPVEPAVKAIDLPLDLQSFQAWWTSEDNSFGGTANRRVPPRGATGAPLMVLVAMPEASDSDTLLQGPHGQLVSNILAALGIDPAAAYFASAMPAHMPLPDWQGLAADGLGAVLLRHVELVRPQRVLLFGSKLPVLLGHDPASPPEAFAAIGSTTTLTTFAPDRLLEHARQRARLWKRLLEWTAPQ